MEPASLWSMRKGRQKAAHEKSNIMIEELKQENLQLLQQVKDLQMHVKLLEADSTTLRQELQACQQQWDHQWDNVGPHGSLHRLSAVATDTESEDEGVAKNVADSITAQKGSDYGKEQDEDYGKEQDEDYGKEEDEDYGKEEDEDYGKEEDEDYGEDDDDDKFSEKAKKKAEMKAAKKAAKDDGAGIGTFSESEGTEKDEDKSTMYYEVDGEGVVKSEYYEGEKDEDKGEGEAEDKGKAEDEDEGAAKAAAAATDTRPISVKGLKVGDHVVVDCAFSSDSGQGSDVLLRRGEQGVVVRLNHAGSACIDFKKQEKLHWVMFNNQRCLVQRSKESVLAEAQARLQQFKDKVEKEYVEGEDEVVGKDNKKEEYYAATGGNNSKMLERMDTVDEESEEGPEDSDKDDKDLKDAETADKEEKDDKDSEEEESDSAVLHW